MRIYFDTSTLSKCYVKESGSEKASQYLFQADEVLVSSIVYPEVISALNRKLRESIITSTEYEDTKMFTEEFLEMTVIPTSLDIALLTDTILESSILRGMDSVHIATAINRESDLFLTSDKKQYESAIKSGLKSQYID